MSAPKIVLQKNHKFVDISPQAVTTRSPNFYNWARSLPKGYAVSECSGNIYLNWIHQQMDGKFVTKTVLKTSDTWNGPKSVIPHPKPTVRKPPSQLVEKSDLWNNFRDEPKSDWATESIENMSTLGNSSRFVGFQNGSRIQNPQNQQTQPEKEAQDEANTPQQSNNGDQKDEEAEPTGKPKYYELLSGVDVIRVVCTHHNYKVGEPYPKPPAWEEYKQLIFDIMCINKDDIDDIVPLRHGVQAGAWLLLIRLRTRYNLKNTYEKCAGKFEFGVDKKTKGFVHRWDAEIEGFDPEKNVEKRKFKLRLTKEIGVKPHHVLAAAKRVMKVVGRGILKERYPAESGLVDSEGRGLGTGFYYFFAQKEQGVNYPEFLKVHDYRIRIWTPERNEELEKEIQANPDLRRNRRIDPDESRNVAKKNDPLKPRVQREPKVLNNFMPDYKDRLIEEAEQRLEEERLAKLEKEKRDAEDGKDGEGSDDVVSVEPANAGEKGEAVATPPGDGAVENGEVTPMKNTDENPKTSTPSQDHQLQTIDEKIEEKIEDSEDSSDSSGSGSDADNEPKPDNSGKSKKKKAAKRNRSKNDSEAEARTKKAKKFVENCMEEKDKDEVRRRNEEIAEGDDADAKEDVDKSLHHLTTTQLEATSDVLNGTRFDDRVERFNDILGKKPKDIGAVDLIWILNATGWKTSKGNAITSTNKDRLLTYFRELQQRRDQALDQLKAIARREAGVDDDEDEEEDEKMVSTETTQSENESKEGGSGGILQNFTSMFAGK